MHVSLLAANDSKGITHYPPELIDDFRCLVRSPADFVCPSFPEFCSKMRLALAARGTNAIVAKLSMATMQVVKVVQGGDVLKNLQDISFNMNVLHALDKGVCSMLSSKVLWMYDPDKRHSVDLHGGNIDLVMALFADTVFRILTAMDTFNATSASAHLSYTALVSQFCSFKDDLQRLPRNTCTEFACKYLSGFATGCEQQVIPLFDGWYYVFVCF